MTTAAVGDTSGDTSGDTCEICAATGEDVCDGLCEACYGGWSQRFAWLSRVLPGDTPVVEAFRRATMLSKAAHLSGVLHCDAKDKDGG